MHMATRAKQWTDAHEYGAQGSELGEKCMDTWNNYFGRQIFEALPSRTAAEAKQYIYDNRTILKYPTPPSTTPVDDCNGSWP